jgi:hypothetical protein
MLTGMTAQDRNQFILESFQLAKKEATEALEARDKAEQRLQRANEACLAWKIIAEQAGLNMPVQNGHTPQDSSVEAKPVTPAREPVYAGTNKHRPGMRAPMSDPELHNKAAFVRTAVETAGPRGISPGDIKKAALGAGIEIYNGYPYTVLFRLKEQGKVNVIANGNYVMAT